jgi:hypothetical protein
LSGYEPKCVLSLNNQDAKEEVKEDVEEEENQE